MKLNKNSKVYYYKSICLVVKNTQILIVKYIMF